MEYWYWLSDSQLEQKFSSFLLLLLKRLYQFIKMLKENEREKWVYKCNHFFLERQYILHIYLYDSGWLWKKYFDDLLSWKTQFYFKIMTETVKLVLNFCLLNTHIYIVHVPVHAFMWTWSNCQQNWKIHMSRSNLGFLANVQ